MIYQDLRPGTLFSIAVSINIISISIDIRDLIVGNLCNMNQVHFPKRITYTSSILPILCMPKKYERGCGWRWGWVSGCTLSRMVKKDTYSDRWFPSSFCFQESIWVGSGYKIISHATTHLSYIGTYNWWLQHRTCSHFDLYSLSGKTSYHQISWSLEAALLVVILISLYT